ncbi:MAG: S1 RNA-binding domain-containing protein, partial [Acidobacteriota bacterium]
MATENITQSGASAAADSAKEAAELKESAGPDSGAETPQPAAETIPAQEQSAEPTAASEATTTSEATAASEATTSGEATGADFGAMLENYEKETARQEGEIVRGVVVGITDQSVLIDIGYKSEGVVVREEFLDRQGNLTVKRGDEVDVLIKSLENQDGYAVLSRADAMKMQSWDRLRHAHQTQETIKARVLSRIKGGLQVDIDGVPAFLPGSQIDLRPVRNPDSFVGQEIEVRVIKLNRKRSNVVVSRKAVLEEVSTQKKAETLSHIEENVILEGTVKNITDYGAFIDLGGIDGLLHIIDMSWGRIQSPGEILKVGDPIQVKVLK